MAFLEERARLWGRVGVLVGGGGGLGRACALDLGRAGMSLELCDRQQELLERTVEEVRSGGGSARGEVLDARDPEALEGFWRGVAERHTGGVHALVNVVGGTFRQPFVESNPRGWDALIRTNFTWMLHSIRLAVPLLATRGGSIINLTSIEAHRAAPDFAVYCSMKSAVESLSRTLAVELGPQGIRVNTIAPDHIITEGLAGIEGVRENPGDHEREEMSPGRRAIVPLSREGTYADVGNCALFLASDLSSYITGTSLHPDGGALAASGWWYEQGVGFRSEPDVGPPAG